MAGFLLLASGMAGLFLLAPAADALTIPVTPLASAQLIAIAPEPGTFLLAGTGLLGLAWQGRRRSDPRVRPRARTSG